MGKMPRHRYRAKKNYGSVKAGQPIRFDWTRTDFFAACCDCGLVHLERYKVDGKYLTVRRWRAENRTRIERKKRRIRVRLG